MRVDVQLNQVLALAVLLRQVPGPYPGDEERSSLDSGCHRLDKLDGGEYHDCLLSDLDETLA